MYNRWMPPCHQMEGSYDVMSSAKDSWTLKMPKHRRKSMSNTETPSDQSKDNFPPKRQGKATNHPQSAPLSKASFNSFIYALCTVAVCIIAFYTYRITLMKSQAGGWWNLATGKFRPSPSNSHQYSSKRTAAVAEGINENNVEARISELASAFGIPAATLATAIASAVSAHVPTTGQNHPTASLLQSMVQDEAAQAESGTKGFISRLSNIVGFEDTAVDLDWFCLQRTSFRTRSLKSTIVLSHRNIYVHNRNTHIYMIVSNFTSSSHWMRPGPHPPDCNLPSYWHSEVPSLQR